MVKLTDERIAFHQFWLWEYQRRNSEYKETYDNFMRKLSQIDINYEDVIALPGKKSSKFSEKDWKLYRLILDEKNSFIEKFDREPKAYREGYDSENLLRDILSGNENYLFLPYVINGILKATELPNYDRVDGYTEWPHLTVRLDLTEDLDLLLDEISFYYYQFHYEFHLKKMSDSNEYSEHENFEDVLKRRQKSMNYPAAELRGIKMNFYLINPDAEHRGILLIKFLLNVKKMTIDIETPMSKAYDY